MSAGKDWFRRAMNSTPARWTSASEGDDSAIDIEFELADGSRVCLQLRPVVAFMVHSLLEEYLTPEREAVAILERQSQVEAYEENYRRLSNVHSETLCGTSNRKDSA